MGKGSLLGCSQLKCVYPRPRTAAPVRESSKSASTLFTPAPVSNPPEAPPQKAGEETCHLPLPPSLAELSRHRGTRGHGQQHFIPPAARSGDTQQRHRPPFTPSQLLSRLGPQQSWSRRSPWHLCPMAKGLGGQRVAAPQARTGTFPNLGQRLQAGGLLIASRGALVCLSVLQQTRFTALIPIWK